MMDRNAAWMTLISAVGLLLSLYALWVEMDDGKSKNSKAMCDISERISCSKVFHSKYGRGFGVIGRIFGEKSVLNQPNSVAGIGFYVTVIALGYSRNRFLVVTQTLLVLLSNLLTVYLAFLLYFVLENFCIVCVSLYVVNVLNMVFAWNRLVYPSGQPRRVDSLRKTK